MANKTNKDVSSGKNKVCTDAMLLRQAYVDMYIKKAEAETMNRSELSAKKG